MSISPYFESVLGGDLTEEELDNDSLLTRVIGFRSNFIKVEDELTAETDRYDRALRALNVVGSRAAAYKNKKALEVSLKRTKIKKELDLQVAGARTQAKLRLIPIGVDPNEIN